MLPFRVIQTERCRTFQQKAYRPLLPNASLQSDLSFEPNLATRNRKNPDRSSRQDFAAICTLNSGRWTQKNKWVSGKWAPLSNRKWVKSRSYRKQTTRPCLTEAGTHIKLSLNFTKIAQGSDELYN